jgi:outer membrane protease
MRSHVIQTVLLLLIFCLLGSAVGAVDVGFDFQTQKMFGHTKFYIKFSEYEPLFGTDVKGESELEFPLDMFLIGGCMRLKGKLKSGEPWRVKLGVSKNLNHPSNDMKDTDWITLPGYNIFHKKFSYTESDAELKALLIYVEGRFGLMTRPNFVLELMGGYELQDFSFEIFGVRGWQGLEWDYEVHFDTLQGVNVLDYDVTYHIPYGGMAACFQFSPRLSLEAKGAIAPNVSASDHDDHLLRFKTADSDCSGWALKAGTDLRWVVFGISSKSNWSLGVGFDFMKISTKGTQDQSWYGDDPASPEEDDTGRRITGIKQKITSNQFAVQTQIGYQF